LLTPKWRCRRRSGVADGPAPGRRSYRQPGAARPGVLAWRADPAHHARLIASLTPQDADHHHTHQHQEPTRRSPGGDCPRTTASHRQRGPADNADDVLGRPENVPAGPTSTSPPQPRPPRTPQPGPKPPRRRHHNLKPEEPVKGAEFMSVPRDTVDPCLKAAVSNARPPSMLGRARQCCLFASRRRRRRQSSR